jgi:hypothetical protein
VDIYGRPAPGQAYCGAGSPGQYLASGRRGPACPAQVDATTPTIDTNQPKRPRLRVSRCVAESCRSWNQGAACGAAGPASAPGSALERPARRTPGHIRPGRRSRPLIRRAEGYRARPSSSTQDCPLPTAASRSLPAVAPHAIGYRRNPASTRQALAPARKRIDQQSRQRARTRLR